MRRSRWLAPWKNSSDKPAIYHCLSRVVDRRFVLGDVEREQFRKFMRMQENFSGCRVLAYCLMSNHFHLLLEVPPMPEGGLSDELLLSRMAAIYSAAFVATVAEELRQSRQAGNTDWVEIHGRYSYRMHNLSEFMKTLLQRFTCWFNRIHQRSGTLWEQRYKSVIVESGIAARTIAAYIDLNPVRAGMVKDPAAYRWSSYGEAIGGGKKGNGKKAREGLVRACLSHRGIGFESEKWQDAARNYRQILGLALARKSGRTDLTSAKHQLKVRVKSAQNSTAQDNDSVLPEIGLATLLLRRVRYFSDGAVIGSKAFVNEAFTASRERFTSQRRDGARKLKGPAASAAAGILWSMRDLKRGIS
jgi:putative transposase